MGIAQPLRCVIQFLYVIISIYIIAGITIPPTAPIIGNSACLGLDNSPCKNSLLISRCNYEEKNIAINASFIQWITLRSMPKFFVPINYMNI